MINGIKPLEKSLRWGMVGGGGTSQIGYIHRSSALRDHTFTLVAGAFDIDAARGRAFGEALGLSPDRCYADYETLFATEGQREDGIQAVSIATPNNTHFAVLKSRSKWGFRLLIPNWRAILINLKSAMRCFTARWKHCFRCSNVKASV